MRLWVWWCLHGQFSRLVRALWPGRRRAYVVTEEPARLEESWRLLQLRIKVVAVPHTSGPPALKRLPGCTCDAQGALGPSSHALG